MKMQICVIEPRRRPLLAALAPALILASVATHADAATVALKTSTGAAWTGTANTCTYSSISTDSAGNVSVVCAGATATPVNGVCGSANGTTVTTTPAGAAACSAGSVTGMQTPAAAGGDYTWTCAGVSGGTSSGTCTAHQSTVVTPPPADTACGTMPSAYVVVEPGASAFNGTWKPDSSGSTYVAQLPPGAGMALKFTANTRVYPYGFKITDSTGGAKTYVISRCPGSSVPVDNQNGTTSVNGDARADSCKVNNGFVRWVNTSGNAPVYYAGASLSRETTCFLPTTNSLGTDTPATYYLNILNTGATAVGVQYSNNPQGS